MRAGAICAGLALVVTGFLGLSVWMASQEVRGSSEAIEARRTSVWVAVEAREALGAFEVALARQRVWPSQARRRAARRALFDLQAALNRILELEAGSALRRMPGAEPAIRGVRQEFATATMLLEPPPAVAGADPGVVLFDRIVGAREVLDRLVQDLILREGFLEQRAGWSVFVSGFWWAAGIAGVPVAAGLVVIGAEARRMSREAGRSRRLSEAVRRARDGVAITDDTGRFVYMNRSHAHLFGYSEPSDLIGRGWWALYSERERYRIRNEGFAGLMRVGSWSGESVGVSADGEELPHEISLTALADGGTLCIARDISERKRMQRELARRAEESQRQAGRLQLFRQSQSDLLTAIDAADIGVMICDPCDKKLRLRRVNDAFTRMTGYSEAEVIGRDPRFLQGPETESAPVEELRSAISVMRRSRVTLLNYRKDGETFWNDLIVVPLREPDGTLRAWAGVMLNVTASVWLERERADLVEKFHESQKMEAIGRLASGVAHDLNNVLAIMMGFSEVLRDEVTGEQREYVDTILAGGERGRMVIDRLLAFARHDTARTRELRDLAEIVGMTATLLRGSTTHPIDLSFDISDIPMPVTVDASGLEQAIINLFVNARDALESPSGRIRVTLDRIEVDGGRASALTRSAASWHDGDVVKAVEGDEKWSQIWYGLLEQGAHARLVVEDTGAGIPGSVAQRMFDPFFTTKPSQVGTGLGMSSVLDTVRSHAGALHIKSTVGEGTRVSVYLPIETGTAAVGEPAADTGQSPKALEGPILLVDDEPAILESVGVMLERAGYTVWRCESASDALDVLNVSGRELSALVTDYAMPGATGIDLARHARDINPGVRVVVCTGVVDQVDAEDPRSALLDAVLQKPVSSERLAQVLSAAPRDRLEEA